MSATSTERGAARVEQRAPAPQQRGATSLGRRRSLYAVAAQPRSEALRSLPIVLLGMDVFVISASLLLATALHAPIYSWALGAPGSEVPGLAVAGPVVTALWIAAVAALGGYDSKVLGATATEFSRVLRASLACAAVVSAGCYLTRFELSRGWFLLTFVVGTVLVLAWRAVARSWLKRSRARGFLRMRVLLVGDEGHIDAVAGVLRRESWLGYEIVGALAPPDEAATTRAGVPVIGDLTAVSTMATKAKADVVLLAGGAVTTPEALRDIAWDLEHAHAQLVVVPSVTDVSAERIDVRPVGGLPLIHLGKPRAAKAARRAKRTFDLVGAGTILLLLSPVFAYCAARVWLHDRGPVFFRQQRVGRHGDTFGCYKFRSMAVDAEAKLQAVLAAQGVAHSAFAKLKVDPRITKPGHWLRRYSLDELPQLINVLRGDMSLVGPRPQTPAEVAHYDGPMSRRLHVRPGMTGLWQVSGRSDLSVAESMRLDLFYVDNWSMMQDLSILARTLSAVLASRGAY